MSGVLARKRLWVVGAIVALIIVGAAVAYFTSTGSGTGSGSVGSAQPVTLHGTAITTLFPGTSSEVDFTVDNPTPGTERVGTIHLDSVTTDAAHSGCLTSAFTMPDVVANQSIPSGTLRPVTAKGTLTMADDGTNQDACQGAPLTLHLSST